MYKQGHVVTDQRTLIINGPYIREIPRTWGKDTERRIGYHTRNYLLVQMDRFRGISRGDLAHSTHTRGTGSYEKAGNEPHVKWLWQPPLREKPAIAST